MATITTIISTTKRVNGAGKEFYLSQIVADDDEQYSLAGSHPPQIGQEIWTDFSDRWNRPIAGYNNDD